VSSPRSVAETVALLDRLRRAVRDSVTRGDELDKDTSLRTNRLRAQFEQAVANERSRWTTETSAVNEKASQQQSTTEARGSARRNRLTKALENARRQRLQEIESEESHHTLGNQDGLLEAEQLRDAELQQNKSRHETFAAELTNEFAALNQLSARGRAALGGFRSLAKSFAAAPPPASLNTTGDENALLDQLRVQRDLTARELSRCNALVLPVFFRVFRLWLCVLLALLVPLAFVPELRRFDFAAVPTSAWAIVGGALAGIFALHFLTRQMVASRAQAAATALAGARRLAEVCGQTEATHFEHETNRIRATYTATTQALNDRWKQLRNHARDLRNDWNERLSEQARQLNLLNDEKQRVAINQSKTLQTERIQQLDAQTSAAVKKLESDHQESLSRINATRDEARRAIEAEWQNVVLPTLTMLRQAATEARAKFPDWNDPQWQAFQLPEQFLAAALFGALTVDLERFCEVSLTGKHPSLPDTGPLAAPLQLAVPHQASILFETKNSGHEQVIGALNNVIIRLLTSAPPGRLAFTIFDPVGLGQNFAGIMHLADFEERVINSRIWTQPAQIEQRLADLNEHIEKVTQMYLRNEYETLAEYNEQAGRLAEKYQFLVIADFPTNFTEVAVKRLQSIAASGPRCGVHLLIHWDQRKTAPTEFVPEELRKNAICIVPKGDGFALANANWDGTKLSLESPPNAELLTQLLQHIGKASTDSYRVEMPFEEVAPDDNELWSLDTTNELRVPVGRTGATKLQYLALGQGTRQHGLVAGKTGSGKSTLFHVIITNLALWCSPEQVEFYLVDFKKGVEFKTYATHKLPHARVIAIESDREFGLSVLQRVDDELKRRGDLFRKLGAQNVPGYKAAGGTEPMPRVLLLIDEFQELFVEDDRVSQGAALLLDRIVRQGRAFGIHVLLGSQTLGGAYTLARATIGQMVVRVALQCNEADAYLIMNEDNPAPRLLSRPGEAIYNDEGGAIQGNSPFQVVWLPDQVRDEWLDKVKIAERRAPARLGYELSQLAEPVLGAPKREPIVFEGNAPANVDDNPLLRSLLNAGSPQTSSSPRVWLGAPNSIKGPTEAVFRRQSGSHLLIVGQREEAALGMLGIGLISLATQLPKASARFLVFDCSAPDSAEAKFLEQAVAAIPHETKIIRAGDVDEVMNALASEQQTRAEQSGGAETFLFVHGLQRNKKLKFDEEMSFSLDASSGANAGLQFNKLITEGAGLGFHVIATCDSYNNVMRFLSRKAVSEFEMRVVFQMSANDSASLIESPQANDLGLHRAILFNGQEGWTETFRPYALPETDWIAAAGQALSRLHA
jgi:S-DNA-T family DNA segregation ATPase FtsK/SpoIIIE